VDDFGGDCGGDGVGGRGQGFHGSAVEVVAGAIDDGDCDCRCGGGFWNGGRNSGGGKGWSVELWEKRGE
jgi:hypothetical protein